MTLMPWHKTLWERLPPTERLGHALLLAGPGGIGKTAFAYALAGRLLCAEDNGCGQCRSCHLLAVDSHPDLFVAAPAAGKSEIAVDEVRALTAFMGLTAHIGRRRVVIIEVAEKLNRSAANALLKNLEEPPPDCYVILVSHSAERLPPTIRSRCQCLCFPVPPYDEAIAYLRAAGCERPEAALACANGAPLKAAALTAAELDREDQLIETLEDVGCGREDPLAAAERWSKGDQQTDLALLASIIARCLQIVSLPAAQGTQKPPTGRLRALVVRLDLRKIFAWWDTVLDYRALADAPLDRRLIWDEVFLCWQQMSGR